MYWYWWILPISLMVTSAREHEAILIVSEATLKNVVENSRKSLKHSPDSKVHGTNMGLIWGRQHPGGPHVGPMNFAILEFHHITFWRFVKIPIALRYFMCNIPCSLMCESEWFNVHQRDYKNIWSMLNSRWKSACLQHTFFAIYYQCNRMNIILYTYVKTKNTSIFSKICILNYYSKYTP